MGMTTRPRPRVRTCLATALAAALMLGCATARGPTDHVNTGESDDEALPLPEVARPLDAAMQRDDPSAAILTISSIDRAVFPYVYGYPIYPEGDAARGIPKLRSENADGVQQSEVEDESGVKLASEDFPALGCRFDGVQES